MLIVLPNIVSGEKGECHIKFDMEVQNMNLQPMQTYFSNFFGCCCSFKYHLISREVQLRLIQMVYSKKHLKDLLQKCESYAYTIAYSIYFLCIKVNF